MKTQKIRYTLNAHNQVVRVTKYSNTADPSVNLWGIEGSASVILRSDKAVFDTEAEAQAHLIERTEWELARNH